MAREQQMMTEAKAYASEFYGNESSDLKTKVKIAETIADFCAGWIAADDSGWIPVEKRLPPVDEDYVKQGFAEPDEEGNILTVSTTVLVTDGKYVETTFYMFELKRWNSQMDDTKITHWMPLPMPPQGKEDKE